MQTTNNANIIVEKPAATRHIINQMFVDGIPTLNGTRETTRALRQAIVIHAEHELGLTEAAAASAYNHARQQACAQGLVIREARGLLRMDPAFNAEPVYDGKWLIIDKITGKIVGDAKSRRTAYDSKSQDQKVVKNS